MSKDDFASLLEAQLKGGGGARRLRNGETVEGTVIQIGADTIFVDVGATTDARLERAELENAKGELSLKVGDRVRATVVDSSGDAPRLSVGIGRGPADVSGLEIARESGTPVSGRVLKAVKGGVEVDVGGVRAFCPASQLELGRAPDLTAYEGQALDFRVLEVRDGGRSVVLSRRALLEVEKRERQRGMLEQLVPGADLDGVVHSIDRHGAVVDLGGIEGFVHISELSHHRVERVEDFVTIGQPVTVRVISIEETPKGVRVRLSMKAREQAPAVEPANPEEVLVGSVVRATNSGVVVTTAKGEGLIPVRELGLPPGSDHRRAYPAGREISVVVLSRDSSTGRMRFSKTRVADVEERKNYREFSQVGSRALPSSGLGSLGDVLRSKLGLPEARPEPARAAPVRPAPSAPPPEAPPVAKQDAPAAASPAPEAEAPAERPITRAASTPRSDPPGVVRRKR